MKHIRKGFTSVCLHHFEHSATCAGHLCFAESKRRHLQNKRRIIFVGNLLSLLKNFLRGISYYFLHNQVHFQQCNIIGLDSRAQKNQLLRKSKILD